MHYRLLQNAARSFKTQKNQDSLEKQYSIEGKNKEGGGLIRIRRVFGGSVRFIDVWRKLNVWGARAGFTGGPVL